MAKTNTSQHSGHKRTSSAALSPRLTNKNRYTPIAIHEDQNVDNLEEEDMDLEEVKQKIPPLYIYEIDDYIMFLDKITPMIVDNFNINNKNVFLKLNLTTVDDYRTITKYLSEIKIKYHTYQLPEERNLSVIIRNMPTSIPEETIFKALVELKFNVTSVTRLQNRYKSPIPIVAVLLDKSEKNIFSLDRLLHCVIAVESRKSDSSIPQCKNCQRFQHTKNFCNLPPRCVKCLENHHYSECTKDINTPPTCVNCNESHPANYRGCKIYKQIKIKNSSKRFRNAPKHIMQSSNLNDNNNTKTPAYTVDHINTQNQDPIQITQNLSNTPTYAEKTKKKTNQHQKEEINNSNITNELIKSLMPLISSLISQIIKKVIENLPALLNNINVV
ncbi:unnamed protein product [Macrosiphum euphorbiae]|uniref:Pre-C2HC domain-containing protein n=1 Tax=Macrosiphum euphorbiae TaxID=13131 RepID=A0AAV0WA57_9HEMI|nr:unnamed protein product [Macrosiphum euphorbiae]